MSIVKDMSLAESGRRKIQWVRDFMPALSQIEARFLREKPFQGLRVAVSVHLEAKTANLGYVLKQGGAEVYLTGSNPLSTQDDVAAGLADMGVETFGKAGEPFDPNLHNAVMHIEDESLGKNVVAQVFQSGYRRGDRILRHAMVQQAN